MNNRIEHDLAATQLQKYIRGRNSRKNTNGYGRSEGKEIEIYLPWALKKIHENTISYKMIGSYQYTVCTSDLFDISIDHMKFKWQGALKIPEIVTVPFRKEGETNSNLPYESEIDKAVADFLDLLEEMIAKENGQKYCILLKDILEQYNQKNPDHPLRLTSETTEYLANPVYQPLFSDEYVLNKEHKDVEICFYYDPEVFPCFDTSATPRTIDAGNMVLNNDYQKGKLLMHVQKTYSLPVENYKPAFFSKSCHDVFHFTKQQLDILQSARQRAENFISKHPLPETASKEKILGLLTLATERVLTVTRAKEYQGLHEKADRSILGIRHILHYVKLNICNPAEKTWFDSMFLEHLQDIKDILCVDKYEADHRCMGGGYGSSIFSQNYRYDAIFDLFGIFKNGFCISQEDMQNAEMISAFETLHSYGISSWEKLLENHISLSGRSHFNLQKVINEQGDTQFQPLFEARRIGLMTIDEFKQNQSCISLAL